MARRAGVGKWKSWHVWCKCFCYGPMASRSRAASITCSKINDIFAIISICWINFTRNRRLFPSMVWQISIARWLAKEAFLKLSSRQCMSFNYRLCWCLEFNRVYIFSYPHLYNWGRGMVEDSQGSVHEHEFFDEYWQSKIPRLQNVKCPAYVICSWGDHAIHTRGTLNGWKQISSPVKYLEIHCYQK